MPQSILWNNFAYLDVLGVNILRSSGYVKRGGNLDVILASIGRLMYFPPLSLQSRAALGVFPANYREPQTVVGQKTNNCLGGKEHKDSQGK